MVDDSEDGFIIMMIIMIAADLGGGACRREDLTTKGRHRAPARSVHARAPRNCGGQTAEFTVERI